MSVKKFLNHKLWLNALFSVLLTNALTAQSLLDDRPNSSGPENYIQFIAPQKAVPIARVGGGIRGTEGSDIVFSVLAPEQIGLTTQAQPTLYWYQSVPAENMEFELTLNLKDETILEHKLSQASNSGIQKLDLTASDISLEPEKNYEWIIALIPDANDRAKDITSSTLIRRVLPNDALTEELRKTSAEQHAYIYAKAGIWYDALASLENTIEAVSDDEKLKLDRVKLFEQVGLEKVAEFEKQSLATEN